MTSSLLFEAIKLTKLLPALPGLRAGKKEATPVIENVNLQVDEGEVLGVVGELGSGKTTLARLAINLMQPTSGQVRFGGRDLQSFNRDEMQEFRRQAQIVFSDPNTAFDPHYTIGSSLAEPLLTHTQIQGDALRQQIDQLLWRVGTRINVLDLFPYQLRPVQLQRIAIARSLALRPRFIVMDDPLSALEPLAQVQILSLIQGLQRKLGFACLFLTPRPVIAMQVSERLAVLLRGKIVETLTKNQLLEEATLHPYTRTLLAAPTKYTGAKSKGSEHSHLQPAGQKFSTLGCPFYSRCSQAMARCAHDEPPMKPLSNDHSVACYLF